MGNEHTPTTEQVRSEYVWRSYSTDAPAEFDRWLAAEIRKAKADAWQEGYNDGRRQDAEGDDGPRFTNPYHEEQA